MTSSKAQRDRVKAFHDSQRIKVRARQRAAGLDSSGNPIGRRVSPSKRQGAEPSRHDDRNADDMARRWRSLRPAQPVDTESVASALRAALDPAAETAAMIRKAFRR